MATTFTLEIAAGYAANTPHTIQVFQGTSLLGSATATVSTVGKAKFLSADVTLSGQSAGIINVSAYDSNDTLTATERYTINAAGVVLDGGVSQESSSIADSTSMSLSVGSTPTKTVACTSDVSTRTLQVVFETLGSGTDVATVADGDITKDFSDAEFAIPAAVTSVERTLRARIVDTDTGEGMANLLVFVTYGPIGD